MTALFSKTISGVARIVFESCVEQGFECDWESFEIGFVLAHQSLSLPEPITPSDAPEHIADLGEEAVNAYADGFNDCIQKIIKMNCNDI